MKFENLDLKIVRSRRRKTIGLQVQCGGKVVVRVPKRVSSSFLRKVLQDKKEWLLKNVAEMKQKAAV